MNEVVEIFMKRDGMSKAEACEAVQNIVDETFELMTSDDPAEAEEFWTSSTGLETDYLLDLI